MILSFGFHRKEETLYEEIKQRLNFPFYKNYASTYANLIQVVDACGIEK